VKKLVVLMALFILICAEARAQEAVFIYDAKGARDPFVPVIPKKGLIGPDIGGGSQIKLEGVLWDSNGVNSQAIINDTIFEEGQTIGEVQVLKIEHDKVRVKVGKEEFVLEVVPEERSQ